MQGEAYMKISEACVKVMGTGSKLPQTKEGGGQSQHSTLP